MTGPGWLPWVLYGVAMVGWAVTGAVCMWQTGALRRRERELALLRARYASACQRADHWRDVAQAILPANGRLRLLPRDDRSC